MSDPEWATEREIRLRRAEEWGPVDYRDLDVPSIPADDPIYTEGVIITFPVVVPKANDDE